MGPPDRCQHAAHVINELILTAQVGQALWSSHTSPGKAERAKRGSRQRHRAVVPRGRAVGNQRPCQLPPCRLMASASPRLSVSCLLPPLFLRLLYYSFAFIILESRFSLHSEFLAV